MKIEQKEQKMKLDKIWDRNPSKSEVIGLCGWDEKTNEKLNVKKNILKISKYSDFLLSFLKLYKTEERDQK